MNEMESLSNYDINFKSLSPGEHHYHFDIGNNFFAQFEGSPVKKTKAQVHLIFDKKSEVFFMLKFKLSGSLELDCDRCLETFDFPADDEFDLIVKLSGNTEGEEDDVVYLPLEVYKINVAQYIYEFYNLKMPLKKVCEQVGKECNPTMSTIVEELSEPPKETEMDPRWEKLKDLKKDKLN